MNVFLISFNLTFLNDFFILSLVNSTYYFDGVGLHVITNNNKVTSKKVKVTEFFLNHASFINNNNQDYKEVYNVE